MVAPNAGTPKHAAARANVTTGKNGTGGKHLRINCVFSKSAVLGPHEDLRSTGARNPAGAVEAAACDTANWIPGSTGIVSILMTCHVPGRRCRHEVFRC